MTNASSITLSENSVINNSKSYGKTEVFTNSEFGSVRTVTINNEPYFVGKDVALILGYSDLNKAIAMHVDNEDKLNDKTSLSSNLNLGQRGGWLINESGLYSLILSSKLPSARKFKHWVTSEVLPSIRSNGGYINNQENLSEAELMSRALIVANRILDAKNKQITEMKPKAEFFDQVTGSADAIEMKEVAKVLNFQNMGRNNLFEFLRNKGILDRNNTPYQKYIDAGLFRVIESKFTDTNGDTHINLKTVVYQKGVDYIRKTILSSNEYINASLKDAADKWLEKNYKA